MSSNIKHLKMAIVHLIEVIEELPQEFPNSTEVRESVEKLNDAKIALMRLLNFVSIQ